jgi:uncharacterized protein YjbI with pentapeptide repeats
MPQVEQISIFLATPGDVPDERNYVEEVVAELNRTIAKTQGMSLRVFRWEEDIYPGYGEDAQAVINAQVGDMSQYDLFVGAMWNRMGTPTPRADSGTLEEFEAAIQSQSLHGQPEIWIYFRDAGAELRTIEELEQRRKVLEFRERVEKQGLPSRYRTPEEFRDKFRVQLSLWLGRRATKDLSRVGKGPSKVPAEETVTDKRQVAPSSSSDPVKKTVAGRRRWRSSGLRLAARVRKRFDLSRQGQGIETSVQAGLINEAVTKSNRLWLILGTVLLCTAIPAGGITDESFLLQREQTLPLVDLKVSAPLFLSLASLMILGLHLWLLFAEYDLLQNLTRAQASGAWVRPGYFTTSLCRYFPADYGFPAGFFVQAAFWAFFFLGPVAVFLHLEICTLRFRHAAISTILLACTATDLLAVVAFVGLCWIVKWSNREFWWGGSRRKRFLSSSLLVGYLIFLVLFSLSYAKLLDDPDTCVRTPEYFWGAVPVRRYISLSHSTSPTKEGAPVEMEAAELAGLDLRCADFSGTHLPKASFAGSTLWGAIFAHANLRGANFSKPTPSVASRQGAEDRTKLRGASFAEADLTNAGLSWADLREADLHGAILQEADLRWADLTGASAFDANLIAADLTGAHLRLGDFRQAQLDYAILDSAKIELARFDEASLDRSSFREASALGASFQQAHLRGAEGLALLGVDLRRAPVFGLNSCNALDARFPRLVDLRDIDFTPVEWKGLWLGLRGRVSPPLGSGTLERVVEAPVNQREGDSVCFSDVNLVDIEPRRERWAATLERQGILYNKLPEQPFFEGWPAESSLTEEEYLHSLVGALIQQACDELSRPKRGESGELSLRDLLKRRSEEIDGFGILLRSRLAVVSCSPRLSQE